MVMGLADDLEAPPPPRSNKGSLCSVRILLNDLREVDPDAAEAFLKAMENPKLEHAEIVRRLDRNGYSIGAHSLSRHRRGNCLCPR